MFLSFQKSKTSYRPAMMNGSNEMVWPYANDQVTTPTLVDRFRNHVTQQQLNAPFNCV